MTYLTNGREKHTLLKCVINEKGETQKRNNNTITEII
jgi:hypothetical protein